MNVYSFNISEIFLVLWIAYYPLELPYEIVLPINLLILIILYINVPNSIIVSSRRYSFVVVTYY